MSESRQIMNRVLKETLVPFLRDRGFRGSLPHFRRLHDTGIDLVTLQFYSSGGRFVVELARCSPDGITTSWGKVIPPNKVTAHDIGHRFRLGGDVDSGTGDHWFVFDRPNYEPPLTTEPKRIERNCRKVALKVLSLFVQQAEKWWRRADGAA